MVSYDKHYTANIILDQYAKSLFLRINNQPSITRISKSTLFTTLLALQNL